MKFIALSLTALFTVATPAIATSPIPVQLAQTAEVDLENLGQDQLESGDYVGAIATYEKLYELVQDSGEEDAISDALQGLAKATFLAQDYARSAMVWEQLLSNIGGSAGDVTHFALALYRLGDYSRAEEMLRLAIDHWETLRANSEDLGQVTLFEQQAHSYRLLQKVLVAQGRTDEALVAAEASRAQALINQLVNQYSGEMLPPPMTLTEIKATARSQNTTIVTYSLVGDEVRVLGIEENPTTDIYIWVIEPSGEIHFRTVNLQDYNIASLREIVQFTRRESIRGRSTRALAETSLQGDTIFQQMYSLLMAPIAEFLPTNPDQKVAIIPQDALFLVPFAALMDAEENYLIEQHTLLMAPSVQVMQLTRDRYPRSSNFPPLVIGNPDMPTVPGQESPLIDLPGAAIEADAIATLFNTQPLLGSQATEGEVIGRMQTAPILHFATHGLLDLDSNLNVYGEVANNTQPTAREGNVFFEPGGIIVSGNVTINGVPANIALAREKVYKVELAGALALTSTAQADGFLTSREIAQLDLQADLVVLSACDTGQGRITGDGVVGLARSFMVAGADSVIVSLWSIPDAPTAQLMITFYQEWEQQGDKAAALRTAMLTTAKEHPHPMNWAAFLLMGSSL